MPAAIEEHNWGRTATAENSKAFCPQKAQTRVWKGRRNYTGSEAMNVLGMKESRDARGVAQPWAIGKIDYTKLVINQYPSFKVNLA